MKEASTPKEETTLQKAVQYFNGYLMDHGKYVTSSLILLIIKERMAYSRYFTINAKLLTTKVEKWLQIVHWKRPLISSKFSTCV
jgi:Tfp pilus assembly PilM family ATPase